MAKQDEEAAAAGKKDDVDLRIEKALVRFSVKVGLLSQEQAEAECAALDAAQEGK